MSLTEQLEVATARSPRRPGPAARILFKTLDVVYGKPFTIEKFRVVELVARVPYKTWQDVAFIAVTQAHGDPRFAHRVQAQGDEARGQSDNETWHLLIMEEMLRAEGFHHSLIRGWLIPQLLAVIYYWLSLVLYVIRPPWSHRLNADFEDHAMRAYAQFVVDHPEFETMTWETQFADDYGAHDTVAEMLRRIAIDEMEHRDRSEDLMKEARFR